ncbi:histidine phosphatase family protein [Shewanella benthica]|uniref:Phosphoglycerate/bisphosphoglycerate mutase n=1 Tax=Shewanella benthica KT99 TaxID=314608 RepID=A9D3D1_9GAMM|nr:histidine phosphatase family protein [Shewanella benthica]EDQ01664.1 Phosphoglycerate/bisphosphoglycerate mutase [Shewanella benthica KT99]
MKILFCRHGETHWNQEGRLQGQLDSKLTSQGQAQARRLGRLLVNLEPDLIMSSDLGRAMATAELVNESMDLVIKASPLLRERCFGELQGVSYDQQPGLWQAYEQRFRGNILDIEGAESAVDIMQRVQQFVDEIVGLDVQNLVVISHGEWLRTLQNMLAGDVPWSNKQALLKNCEVFELTQLIAN